MNEKFAIAIHGGAGTLAPDIFTEELRLRYEDDLRAGLKAGVDILKNGGGSLDAVEAAVRELENSPYFNAGRGSVFNSDGEHEMDAAIMDGNTLAAGAVAGITSVKNPISLARAVMAKGEYVLLSGPKATEFAKALGIPIGESTYFHTDARHDEWRSKQEGMTPKTRKFGTVGAVALDRLGHLAAATSTGGLVNKKYGRVGDSCIIGGGTYASDATCAVSCTGEGEQFIRAVAAHDISAQLAYQGLSLNEACRRVLVKIAGMGGSGGLIAIDRLGIIEMPFTTEGMYRAYRHSNGETGVGIF